MKLLTAVATLVVVSTLVHDVAAGLCSDCVELWEHAYYRGRMIRVESNGVLSQPLAWDVSSLRMSWRVSNFCMMNRNRKMQCVRSNEPYLGRKGLRINDGFRQYWILHTVPHGCARLYYAAHRRQAGVTICNLYHTFSAMGLHPKFGESNDLVSSIEIGPRTALHVFEHWNYRGRSLKIENESYYKNSRTYTWLGSSQYNFNDIISSAKIKRLPWLLPFEEQEHGPSNVTDDFRARIDADQKSG